MHSATTLLSPPWQHDSFPEFEGETSILNYSIINKISPQEEKLRHAKIKGDSCTCLPCHAMLLHKCKLVRFIGVGLVGICQDGTLWCLPVT